MGLARVMYYVASAKTSLNPGIIFFFVSLFKLNLAAGFVIAWEAIRCRSDLVDWGNVVWDSAIMPKHAFLFWLTNQDRLSTSDRLAKWG
jgi:hypothetical protein